MARNRKPRKCSGHSKRTGKPCGAWAIKGGTVCVAHGGAAPQVKAAAEVRAAQMAAHEAAERMVARAGVHADPLEHLLESLYRAAALVEVWGAMVAALDDLGAREAAERERVRGQLEYDVDEDDGAMSPRVVGVERLLALDRDGMATVHPFVTEYQRALDRRAKFAKLCLDAGVAARTVELLEDQVRIAQQAFEKTLLDLGLTDSKRQEARRAHARHLRAV